MCGCFHLLLSLSQRSAERMRIHQKKKTHIANWAGLCNSEQEKSSQKKLTIRIKNTKIIITLTLSMKNKLYDYSLMVIKDVEI